MRIISTLIVNLKINLGDDETMGRDSIKRFEKYKSENIEVNNYFERELISSSENFLDKYLSDEYENYVVEYIGNILESINNIDYASILSGLSNFAIIAVKDGMVRDLLKDVPEIINIEKSYAFLLSDMESDDSTYSYNIINKEGVPFNGEGVIVGIIGTGIDYLNERFMTVDKKSRVVAIWDQTLEKGIPPETLKFGVEFNKSDIDSAISKKILGGNPYEIVPHIDETGEGTAIAGVIGARKLSVGDIMEGIAPNCEFAIVKLKEAKNITIEKNCLVNPEVKIYESTDIGLGIRYLSELQDKLKKPMVVYVPLGNNCSGHDGSNALERYMEIFTNKKGFILTTNTGSEGSGESHTSGNLTKTGDMKTIDLEIAKNEKAFCTSIWITKPSKVSIGVILPNGERIDKISSPTLDEKEEVFKLNNIEVRIQFFIQQQTGGEQVIFILANGDVGGIWQINLYGDYIVEGRYDAWIQQRRLRKKETKFLNTDSYVTLMIPSTSENIIATTYYNQVNDTLDLNAGNGFTRDGRIKPSITVGAKEILTVGKNNTLIVASGAAMAGGILSGVVALLLQWGIVDGNDINLYSSKVNIYLIRGTKREKEIVYPNPQWGYGVLDIQELFKSLTRSEFHGADFKEELNQCIEREFEKDIFINIPMELYRRINRFL